MKFITVSELRAHATRIVAEVESGNEQIVITKHGKPVALIQPFSEEELWFGKAAESQEKEG